jgi:hypothetical protein
MSGVTLKLVTLTAGSRHRLFESSVVMARAWVTAIILAWRIARRRRMRGAGSGL